MLTRYVDSKTGWTIITARIGDRTVSLVPEAGCNVSSIRLRDTELLRQPPSPVDLLGFRYGIPVLYPTPGRVADGRFTYDGCSYTLPADDELGVIHGLACRSPWELGAIKDQDESASVTCKLAFQPGTQHYDAFPFEHTLYLRVTVGRTSIRWDYTVENSLDGIAVPFGFGLHPWFLFQGPRESTWLMLTANEKEVLKQGCATGRREPISAGRQMIALADADMDDVFCRTPETPTRIEFRAANLTLTLNTSDDFEWLVVYTPWDEPWLCVENWTSIPDAHNLHAAGHRRTGLGIVAPAESHQGWVQLDVTD